MDVEIIHLEGNKFFVSYSGITGPWLQMFRELKKETIQCTSNEEAYWTCYRKTIELMREHGIENVRGHTFNSHSLSAEELARIQEGIDCKLASNQIPYQYCTRCFRLGHDSLICYALTDVQGRILVKVVYSSSSSSSSSSDSDS